MSTSLTPKFRVFTTAEFGKSYANLEKSDKNRVNKILKQLAEYGDLIGKPLGIDFFREKKFGGNRLYYLVYKNYFVILAVSMSNKKAQQGTINEIMKHLADYQQSVFERLKKEKII